MPHSLRVKIKNLRYKGIITDKDCDRLITALDNKDVLDKIRERIELEKLGYPPSAGYYKAIIKCLQIIDKYTAEKEESHGRTNQ